MWPAFVRGMTDNLPRHRSPRQFHVIAHASTAIDNTTRRTEQKLDPSLKGLRWTLLKDRANLKRTQRAEFGDVLAHMTTNRTARAWHYREQLREIMSGKQPNVVGTVLNGDPTSRYPMKFNRGLIHSV